MVVSCDERQKPKLRLGASESEMPSMSGQPLVEERMRVFFLLEELDEDSRCRLFQFMGAGWIGALRETDGAAHKRVDAERPALSDTIGERGAVHFRAPFHATVSAVG